MASLVVCTDTKGIIGDGSNLVYDFQIDKIHFKNITSGSDDMKSVLIVGGNTYRNLVDNNIDLTTDNRVLWVLSRNCTKDNTNNIVFFRSYEDIVNKYTLEKKNYNFFVIGGGQIYKLFYGLCKYIYKTTVCLDKECMCSSVEHVGDKICDHDMGGCIKDSTKIKSPVRVNPIILDIDTRYFRCTERIYQENQTDRISDLQYTLCFEKLDRITKKEQLREKPCLIKQNKSSEYEYLRILNNVLYSQPKNGTAEEGIRNGVTFGYFGDQIRFDLRDGFPFLTTKKMAIKSVIEELLFFINGSTDSKKLEAKGVNIWKGNTSREFLDKNGFNDYPEGEMGPMYGYQWRNFNGQLDQMEKLIKNIEDKPFERRHLMTTYNPLQVDQGVLYPCHSLMLQFYVEKIGRMYHMSVMMFQRSADVFLGLPFNIASTSLLLKILCKHLSTDDKEFTPAEVIISLGDTHLYVEHVAQAIEQIERIPLNQCKVNIINKHEKIDDYTMNDIEILDYNSHPGIMAPMKE